MPTLVRGLAGRAVAVSAGLEHTCALLKGGAVECWGANRFGQLGDGSSRDRVRPVLVRGLGGAAIAVSAGGRHTCAVIRRGGVECWGADYFGQVGRRQAPGARRPGARARPFAGGRCRRGPRLHLRGLARRHREVLGCERLRSAWQREARRSAPPEASARPVALAQLPSAPESAIPAPCCEAVLWPAGERTTLASSATAHSRRAAWRSPSGGWVSAVMVSTGVFHTCATTRTGGVRCWGMNASGELGAGTLFERSTPLRVAGISRTVEVAAGGGHTCARTSEGTVECWGANNAAQLGNRTRLVSATPTPLSGLPGPALSLAAGDRHTCALTTTGEVSCWGANDAGQLGDGSLLDRDRAVRVHGLRDGSVRITAGENHTCVLSAESAVRCWGKNASGQLGDGTFIHAPACGAHTRSHERG